MKNPFGFLLHHDSHANNPHLKVFEKNGKFGVGTDETNVPQFTFNTKDEADDYVRLAQDYDKEAARAQQGAHHADGLGAAASTTGAPAHPPASSVSQAAPNEEPTQDTANRLHKAEEVRAKE